RDVGWICLGFLSDRWNTVLSFEPLVTFSHAPLTRVLSRQPTRCVSSWPVSCVCSKSTRPEHDAPRYEVAYQRLGPSRNRCLTVGLSFRS
ncbi:hypothetical protein CH063_06814, partial [Colletotrichum higginsianum]